MMNNTSDRSTSAKSKKKMQFGKQLNSRLNKFKSKAGTLLHLSPTSVNGRSAAAASDEGDAVDIRHDSQDNGLESPTGRGGECEEMDEGMRTLAYVISERMKVELRSELSVYFGEEMSPKPRGPSQLSVQGVQSLSSFNSQDTSASGKTRLASPRNRARDVAATLQPLRELGTAGAVEEMRLVKPIQQPSFVAKLSEEKDGEEDLVHVHLHWGEVGKDMRRQHTPDNTILHPGCSSRPHATCSRDSCGEPIQPSSRSIYFEEDQNRTVSRLSSMFNTDDDLVPPERQSLLIGSGETQRNIGAQRSVLCLPSMDTVAGLLVLVNAIWIGFEVDYQARHQSLDTPPLFEAVDTAFCACFALEILSRLRQIGTEFFTGDTWLWNVFDFAMVGTQVFEKLAIAFAQEELGGISNLRILRIYRVIRIARIFRAVRLIDEFRSIATSVFNSMQTFVWSVVFITMTVCIFGIALMSLIVDTILSKGSSVEMPEEMMRWYGSLPRTILTLFEIITSGTDWDICFRPLLHELGPGIAILYILYVLFSTVAMMNVITGVFVDAMIDNAQKVKEERLATMICEVFATAEDSDDYDITWKEFQSKLEKPALVQYFKEIDVDISEAHGLFTLIDSDGTGSVSLADFVSSCVRLRGPAKALELSLMMHEMRNMDEYVRDSFDAIKRKLRVPESHIEETHRHRHDPMEL